MSVPISTIPNAAGASSGSRPAPALGALFRSELLRARSRRSVRWLVGLAVAGVLVVAGILWATTSSASLGDLDAAAERFLAEQREYYEMCIADPQIPEAEKEMACWIPSEEEARANAFWMLEDRPFVHDDLTGLLSFAGGLGTLVALLIAASAGGADWGARTMGLLLSWEPRRLRLFTVRLVITTVTGAAAVAVVAAVALAAAAAVAASHGLDPALSLTDSSIRPVDWGDARELALRWLPVGGLAAAGSFAVAMAARSTGWAIGAMIGLVTVVESVIQGLWAWGSQWLVQTNILAWLQGGMEWVVDRAAMESRGVYLEPGMGQPGTIWLSDTRALATLAAMVVVALLISVVMLTRRDVD